MTHTTHNIEIFSSPEKLAAFSGELIKKTLQALPEGALMTLAVSGGTTPRRIFTYWASCLAHDIEWNRIKIFWVDERCVPHDHEESNFRMTHESLLLYVPIPPSGIFPVIGENDPAEEASRYHQVLASELPLENGIPRFDLVLLGMGEDGHTASIFPGQRALFDSPDFCVPSVHPQTGQQRITLTGQVINQARQVAFIVTGNAKANLLRSILTPHTHLSSPPNVPAIWVHPINGELIWLLDTDAALGLIL